MKYHQRHARALQGASGLQARVFIHYAACGPGRTVTAGDSWLAEMLGCSRKGLVMARLWLLEESLLIRDGNRFLIPAWLRG